MENEKKQIEEAKSNEVKSKEVVANPIEEAKDILKKIEEANLKTAELLKQQNEAYARELLSGKSTSQQEVVKSEKETKKEGALEMFRGSEIEDAIKRYG
jgi:antirestriction protein